MDKLGKKKARLVVQNFCKEIAIDFDYDFLIPGLNALFFVDDKEEEKVEHILMCLVKYMHMFRGSLLII